MIWQSRLRQSEKGPEHPTDILDRIDLAEVTERLRQLLEIRNREEQTVKLDEAHGAEIKEYLELLDLTREIEIRYLPDVKPKVQPHGHCAARDSVMRRRMR